MNAVEVDAGQDGMGAPSLLAGYTVVQAARACGPSIAKLVLVRLVLDQAWWMACLELADQGRLEEVAGR